jgi:tetratricopeptide (TPR) repeat protein
MKNTLILILLLSTVTSHGQILHRKAEKMAESYDSLYQTAYERKNYDSCAYYLNNLLSVCSRAKLVNEKMVACYNLACVYSLKKDKEESLDYLKQAVKLSSGSLNLTYYDVSHDSDLMYIRKEPEYAAVVSPLRTITDYVYLLKRGSTYNPSDDRQLPGFTYENPSDTELQSLRKAFNLDSIAGNGADTAKIIRLLNWIHYLIPHDGSHDNPVVKNATSMISQCKKEKRGLNCRGLAIVLNECYLAMGYASRIVTCLPKDSLHIDPDCHVINAVFVPSLHKWVWMDPTHDAYIKDERGNLLSIEEVRKGIIEGKPLIVNKNINWNSQPENADNYLYNYMAKNLYMLECPVSSRYNMETREAGQTYTYVQLLPMDYFKQKPDLRESIRKNKKITTTWLTYMTNNAGKFWAAPAL